MSARPRLRTMGASGEVVQQLNTSWRIAHRDQPVVSFRQRLAAPLRRFLVRMFGTQETFNSLVVQYVNALQENDRQRSLVHEDALDQLQAIIDSSTRVQESFAARERRMDAALAGLHAAHDELGVELKEIRMSLGVLHHATTTLSRRLDGLGEVTTSVEALPLEASRPAATEAAARSLGHSYVGFEDEFRGSPEAIAEKLASYVPIFNGRADVLDLGCGRGEFLALLGQHGITARGIDLNASMVDVCRAKGLAAEQADALSFLRRQPAGSLGGIIAAQVIEHLEPAYLAQLLEESFAKLRPGSPIVLETINPACWFAFFESYIRDITHVRPLHPDTLKFLLVANGFQQVEIQYRAPYPEAHKLQPVQGLSEDAGNTLNANAAKLNSLLFSYLDYAAVAHRP